jgi:alkylation response protein AidB-like acyl-CoA dehydrogenase
MRSARAIARQRTIARHRHGEYVTVEELPMANEQVGARAGARDAEQESRAVAEEARQKEWRGRGFLRELFLGNFRFDWVDGPSAAKISPEAEVFHRRLRSFMEREVDSAAIDTTGEYPKNVIDGLRALGAFGMKIPKQYGGLGLSQLEYSRALEICGRYDGNIVALLSAHQSIGVPQPLKLFGSEDQKKRYLPRCAAGAISAFALTEPQVGSDPASVATRAELTPEGDYVLNGEKLWCTNGTFAELVVVMARTPDNRISAFIVETSWPGIEVGPRCNFMGLRAIENGILRFHDVRVPKENLVGKQGDGLKIALVTLNTGRLGLPAACVGMTKRCVEVVREWSGARVQWGRPIGQHEAIAHKIADITSTTFAIEAMNQVANELAMREGYDIRLEAAVAKEWATVQAYHIVDETLQIRGGRGYETESSLANRGEPAIGIERMLRDCRINLIFEGSSEIMHLFIAREAVDKHLQVAGALVDPKVSLWKKIAALPKIIAFYALWYPTRFLGWSAWPKYASYGPLAKHLRFCDRTARRLARAVFHGMVVHGPKLERRQAFLFRLVDICDELFAMTSAIAIAQRMARARDVAAHNAGALADAFCRTSRKRIGASFARLWRNDDKLKYALAQATLSGQHRFIEHTEPELEPQTGVHVPAPRPASKTRRPGQAA